MNWSDAANCYLLVSIHNHGRNWSKVSKDMLEYSKLLPKPSSHRDFNEQNCSLQYNYIIATYRQQSKAYTNKSHDYLFKLVLNKHIESRVQELTENKKHYETLIEKFEKDVSLLKLGRYEKIPPERLNEYRRLCQAANLPDFIGNTKKQKNFAENEKIEPKLTGLGESLEKEMCSEVSSLDDSKGSSWVILDKEKYEDLLNVLHRPMSKSAFLSKPPKLLTSFFTPDEYRKEMDYTPCSPSVQTFSNYSLKDFNGLNSPYTNNDMNRPGSPDTGISATSEVSSSVVKSSVKTTLKRERYKSQNSDLGEGSSRLSTSSLQGTPENLGVNQAAVTMARRWRRNIMSALSTVCSHRNAHIFMQPVTDAIAPGYSQLIHHPTDLSAIRKKVEGVLANLYTSLQHSTNPATSINSAKEIIIEAANLFLRELLLMFANARIYNNSSHEVFKMTCTMFHDVLCELKPIWLVLSDDIPNLPKLPPISVEAAYAKQLQ